MAFAKQIAFTKKVTDLPNTPSPNFTADEIKSYFQTPADEIAETFNQFIDELNAPTATENLNTVLKDGTTTTVKDALNNITGDRIIDKQITREKLSDELASQPSDVLGIQAKFVDVDTQLADMVTNVKSFGAKGDGVTDDTLAIQNTIDSLPTKGGTVYFPMPTAFYKITKALKVPSNVTLLGAASKPKIKQTGTGVDQANGIIVTNKGYLESPQVANENIHIHNLTLESRYNDFASGTNTSEWFHGVLLWSVSKSSIKDCHVLNTVSEGIYIGGFIPSEDLIIENNRVENCYASGIAVTNGRKIRISKNFIKNATTFGIDLEPNSSCVAKEVVIEGNIIDTVSANYFKNMSPYQYNALGISLNSGSGTNQVDNVVVIGNSIKNVKRYTTSTLLNFGAICIVGANRSTIANNTIEDIDSCGIVVRGISSEITINGNTIKNTYDRGIGVSDSKFITIGKNIINSPAYGMVITSASSFINADGNIIIDSNPTGVLIASSSKVTLSANTLYDTRTTTSRTMQYGIHIASGNDLVNLIGNMIQNTTSDHVRDVDSSTNTLQNGNFEDTAWRVKNSNFHVFSDGNLYTVGWIKPKAMTTTNAQNGSIFVDSADNKLKFKDSAGVVNLLY